MTGNMIEEQRPMTIHLTEDARLDLMRAVRRDRKLTPTEKVIAACIVDCADEHGVAYISDELIRDRSRCTILAVQRARSALCEAGWINCDVNPASVSADDTLIVKVRPAP